jgi:integrase
MQTLKIDTIEDWLNTVAFSHSNSKNTRTNYKLIFGKFLNFIGKTADQLIHEYENTNDRTFKRTYGTYIKAWITQLQKADYAPRTISGHINIVKSFFKYNDLPLSFIPCGNGMVTFHNRDITKEEIVQILKLSDFREKAFYSLIAQTGLRPETLTKLKIGDLEKILDPDTPMPCLITVRQEATKGAYQGYFTFAPEESIKHLKEYLQTRKTPLTKDSLLFCMYNDESKPISPGVFSHLFRRVVMRLQKDNILSFETKRKDIEVKTKEDILLRRHISRNELRLYNLRKFFRKYAGQAGADFVNFWMGHTSALGVDLHYFSRDVEFHRKVFNEKALPFLRIETHTPSETEKQIEELRKENAELRSRLENIEQSRNSIAALLQRVTELEKKLEK